MSPKHLDRASVPKAPVNVCWVCVHTGFVWTLSLMNPVGILTVHLTLKTGDPGSLGVGELASTSFAGCSCWSGSPTSLRPPYVCSAHSHVLWSWFPRGHDSSKSHLRPCGQFFLFKEVTWCLCCAGSECIRGQGAGPWGRGAGFERCPQAAVMTALKPAHGEAELTPGVWTGHAVQDYWLCVELLICGDRCWAVI